MKTIKFRVWDFAKRDFMHFDLFNLNNGFVGIENRITNSINEKPIMQFTGLKDKNGKEIYEGDIIKMSYEELVAPVEYVESWARFCVKLIKERDWRELDQEDCFKCEVIGNIYENPELLAVKK